MLKLLIKEINFIENEINSIHLFKDVFFKNFQIKLKSLN